jgi:hypothetical protein
MSRAAKIANRILAKLGLSQLHRSGGKYGSARNRGRYARRARVETLEGRRLLATTIYLDFGFGYWGDTLETNVNDIAYVADYGPSTVDTILEDEYDYFTTGPIAPTFEGNPGRDFDAVCPQCRRPGPSDDRGP